MQLNDNKIFALISICVGKAKLFVFESGEKWVSYAHQGCIYLTTNTVKT